MENITDLVIYAIGFFLVFGSISFVVNKLEDLFSSDRGKSVGQPTGKVMNIIGDEELVEYEKQGHPGETVVRRQGSGRIKTK